MGVLAIASTLALGGVAQAEFSPPVRTQTLSPAGQHAQEPKVAIDRDGDAIVVWRQGPELRVMARARSAAGVLGPIEAISTGQYPSAPQVAMDRDGNALVVWAGATGIECRHALREERPGLATGRVSVEGGPVSWPLPWLVRHRD